MKKREETILWTIKDLYEWACENHVEEYNLRICGPEAMWGVNCNTDNIVIDKENCEVSL